MLYLMMDKTDKERSRLVSLTEELVKGADSITATIREQ